MNVAAAASRTVAKAMRSVVRGSGELSQRWCRWMSDLSLSRTRSLSDFGFSILDFETPVDVSVKVKGFFIGYLVAAENCSGNSLAKMSSHSNTLLLAGRASTARN
jgi:hypothetical protein